MIMLIRLFDHLRFISVIVVAQRSLNSSKLGIDVVSQMKFFNETNQYTKTLELFDENIVRKKLLCSRSTVFHVLKASSQLQDPKFNLIIHQLIAAKFKNDPYLLASLIHLEMQCGNVTRAESIFNSIEHKTEGAYGAMMKGYVKNKEPKKVIKIFHQIKNPDAITYILLCNACAQLQTEEALHLIQNAVKIIPPNFYTNSNLVTSLIDALVKCDDLKSVYKLFGKLPIKHTNIGTVMMNAYNKMDEPEKTVQIFNHMKNNAIEVNAISYLYLIKALSKIGHKELADLMTQNIPIKYFSDERLQTALIDMWGKTGRIDKAREIYDKMEKVSSCGHGAIIHAYGLNGMGSQAVQLYHQLPSQFRNEIVHICLINACSHSGLISIARSIFETIEMKTDNIYTTMVDCLSRAELFDEAQELIQQYERNQSPSLVMYTALLSGARNARNVLLSQQIYDRMSKLFPQSKDLVTSAATLLANTYSSIGDTNKSFEIRKQMRKSGIKKKPGISWTFVNGRIDAFRVGDYSHPRSADIHAEKEKISNEIVQHGHQYDSSWITRPLENDETIESVLCGHSERLAIAWNFVANPNVKEIQITKNLRVCGDCHRAIKLIATIRQVDIIIRDANRIHHFHTNGQCSCNDYF